MRGVSENPPAAPSISEAKARAEAERSGLPFLVYRDGDDAQQLFTLDPGLVEASVGRQPSSDLPLPWDSQVSRLHARLERSGDDWTVVDDGLSRNGTFVNGERLSGRHRLADGDTVRFGATTTIFRAPVAVERAVPAPAREGAPTVDLSTTQLRVLVELCRPYRAGTASPADDQQIADALFLSVDVVKTHLMVLYAKLELDRLPEDQRRVRLVERAFYDGLVTERDL